MKGHGEITEAEQRLAVENLARGLKGRGYRTLLLGSVAVLYKTDQGQLTKDVDVHVAPTEDFERFFDDITEAVQSLGGRLRMEPDGASITIHLPIGGRDVPIEVIEGREDFIEPHVLSDALESADAHGPLMIPTWEHLICMKAEAWFDRTGPMKNKFLQDLMTIRSKIALQSTSIKKAELERIIRMRPERKQSRMLFLVNREFEEFLAP